MRSIKINNWIVCGNCGCKLAGVNSTSKAKQLFIKCHACKEINEVNLEMGGVTINEKEWFEFSEDL